MVRSSKEAMEAASKQVKNVGGTCQYATRTWFDAPAVGDVDGDKDADAVDGWKSEPVKYRHVGDRKPPPGKPLAFSGGSKGYGHRCISWSGGKTRSTDMKDGVYTKGTTGFATIEQIEKAMGVKYLGWTESISGHVIPPDPLPIVIPPKPGYVEGDVVLASNNVMSLPRNRDINNTLAASTPASIVGLQELGPRSFKAAASGVPNFDLVEIPPGVNYSNAINFDSRIWDMRGFKYVKEYDGVSKISYTRHLVVTRLWHKRLQFEAIAISFHNVTRGNDKNRVRMRRQALAALRKTIRQYKNEGVIVFVMGDYNARTVQHPSASIKLLNGIDHIYVFNSAKVKAVKKSTRQVDTASDHNCFIARIHVKIKV